MRVLGVVFVHGINSSAAVWDAFGALVAGDEELARAVAEPPVRFEYATGIWPAPWRLRVIPSVSTAADSLAEYLVTEAGEFERLVLVGHSQGGLVIERFLAGMLAEGRGLELARIRRVVLLATPNTGSQLLRTARQWLVRRNPQEQGLRPYDELVAGTLRVVMRDVVNAPFEPTARTCRIPFSVYAGEQDGIVTPASAQLVFPEAWALPGDHFSIVRPTSPRHRSFSTVRRLLLEAAGEDRESPDAALTVSVLGAAELEVQNAPNVPVHGADVPMPPGELTAYLSRPHDTELRALITGVRQGGASRLVLLTGESSTGKTRALYQALADLAPDAQLLRPVDAGDLLGLLERGQVGPGCVLWLNEAQRFLYGADGEKVAARLHALLNRTCGIAALATLWTEPYWSELTAPARLRDPHVQARALLTHPGFAVRITVPAHLAAHELDAWRQLAAEHGDARLQQALEAGESDGRVVQHLSGGPELLSDYLAGPGALFTAREHALITAALDARRLGHSLPLPGALLAEAAEGYLTDRQRSPDPDWAGPTLLALATGRRADGTRTDVRATLTAIAALYPRSGAPAVYEPADYLDQYTRRSRPAPDGNPALWRALATYTADCENLEILGVRAWTRGLRTTAVRLWTKAAAAGHASSLLARLGPVLDPGGHAAMFSAVHADLTDSFDVAVLLRVLHEMSAQRQIATLVERGPAAHAETADLLHGAALVYTLKAVGAEREAATLLERYPLADPRDYRVMVSMLQLLAGMDQGAQEVMAHPGSPEPYGREPDGQPSPQWTWSTLIQNGNQQAPT